MPAQPEALMRAWARRWKSLKSLARMNELGPAVRAAVLAAADEDAVLDAPGVGELAAPAGEVLAVEEGDEALDSPCGAELRVAEPGRERRFQRVDRANADIHLVGEADRNLDRVFHPFGLVKAPVVAEIVPSTDDAQRGGRVGEVQRCADRQLAVAEILKVDVFFTRCPVGGSDEAHEVPFVLPEQEARADVAVLDAGGPGRWKREGIDPCFELKVPRRTPKDARALQVIELRSGVEIVLPGRDGDRQRTRGLVELAVTLRIDDGPPAGDRLAVAGRSGVSSLISILRNRTCVLSSNASSSSGPEGMSSARGTRGDFQVPPFTARRRTLNNPDFECEPGIRRGRRVRKADDRGRLVRFEFHYAADGTEGVVRISIWWVRPKPTPPLPVELSFASTRRWKLSYVFALTR